MKKILFPEELLLKIMFTTYRFKELGYYGSKEKAIKALLKRKGFKGYSPLVAAEQFNQIMKEITDTRVFLETELPQGSLAYLGQDEVERLRNRFRDALAEKNPLGPKEMIKYAANWAHGNSYLR